MMDDGWRERGKEGNEQEGGRRGEIRGKSSSDGWIG